MIKMGKKVRCPRCKGKGTVIKEGGFLDGVKEVQCPNCNGTGYVYEK